MYENPCNHAGFEHFGARRRTQNLRLGVKRSGVRISPARRHETPATAGVSPVLGSGRGWRKVAGDTYRDTYSRRSGGPSGGSALLRCRSAPRPVLLVGAGLAARGDDGAA